MFRIAVAAYNARASQAEGAPYMSTRAGRHAELVDARGRYHLSGMTRERAHADAPPRSGPFPSPGVYFAKGAKLVGYLMSDLFDTVMAPIFEVE